MRIDENTYKRILYATNGLDQIGTSIIIFVGKTGQELGKYNYDVFNKFANSQRDVIIEAFLSLRKIAYAPGGILEEIRNIPVMMKSSDNKIQSYINEFSNILDGLITRAENLPIVKTSTLNPYIPDDREAIYDDLYLEFKCRDFYGFNYKECMRPKYYAEGDYVGDLVTSFQQIIVSALESVVSKMEEEFTSLGKKIGVVQKKLKLNLHTKNTSATAPNIAPSFGTGVAVGAAAATLGIKRKPKPKPKPNTKQDSGKFQYITFKQDSGKEAAEFEQGIKNINDQYYKQAQELAKGDEMGRVFTDHTDKHVEMVEDMSLEVAGAIRDSIDLGGLPTEHTDTSVGFTKDIDDKVLVAAARSHDTGMSGNGYSLVPKLDENGNQIKENGCKIFEKDEAGNYLVKKQDMENPDFNEIRENHSLNSALNVLSNREKYKALGYSDSDVNRIALNDMAHSKSSSGVSNLNNKSDWADCFDRIDAAVTAYNLNQKSQISFDRLQFENNDVELSKAVSETFALRDGDVSRNSGPGAKSQSGEYVYVDRSTINNEGGSVEKELEYADITIGESKDEVTNIKSRQVHVGEQNITENRTYADNSGIITHEITINDGVSVPQCTQRAIEDHIGEFACVPNAMFNIKLNFSNPCNEYAQKSYIIFANNMAKKYRNINIILP